MTLKCRNALLFCSTLHVHFSTINHLLLDWFLRSNWQNSHRFFLESIRPLNHSDMTSLIIEERGTSYFPYIWVQIESIATLLYNLDKKGPLLKISMSIDRRVFIYIVLTLCSLKYRPQALQTGSPFWFLLQRVVAVVLQFAQLVPSRREEDWTKKTYLKGLYV